MDFRTLSDSLEADELAVYFNDFLEAYEKKPKNTEALKQLYELAYRQWDTYEHLSDELAQRIGDYLMSAMNFKSYEITDVILSIVENLSLESVFNYMVEAKDGINQPTIRNLIIDAEEEYADRISNPYGDDDDDDWL